MQCEGPFLTLRTCGRNKRAPDLLTTADVKLLTPITTAIHHCAFSPARVAARSPLRPTPCSAGWVGPYAAHRAAPRCMRGAACSDALARGLVRPSLFGGSRALHPSSQASLWAMSLGLLPAPASAHPTRPLHHPRHACASLGTFWPGPRLLGAAALLRNPT
jgi:hypothetical protein